MKLPDMTKKAGWITTGDIGYKALSFFISIILARYLGAEKYGWITIGFSMLGYAIWFTDLGLIQIGTRDAARPKDKRDHPVSTLFISRCWLSLAVLFVGSTVLFLMNIPADQKQFYMLLLCAVIPHGVLLNWYYSGRQRFDKTTIGRIIHNSLYLLLLVVILIQTTNAVWVAFAYLTGISLSALYLFATHHNKPVFFSPIPSLHKMVSAVRNGLIIGTGNIFTQVVILLPPLCIGYFISEEAAGQYGVAFKLVLGAMAVDHIFTTLYLPVLTSKAIKNSVEELSQKLSSITRIIMLTGTVIGFLLFALAPIIIRLLFGESYMNAIGILQILCWFTTFTLINSVFTFGLIALGRDHEYFRSALWGGFISLVIIVSSSAFGNLLWVAWAVTLSECIIMGFRFFEFNRCIPIRINIAFAIVFITIGLIETIHVHLTLELPALLSVGLLLILLLFVSSRSITLNDWYWLKKRFIK